MILTHEKESWQADEDQQEGDRKPVAVLLRERSDEETHQNGATNSRDVAVGDLVVGVSHGLCEVGSLPGQGTSRAFVPLVDKVWSEASATADLSAWGAQLAGVVFGELECECVQCAVDEQGGVLEAALAHGMLVGQAVGFLLRVCVCV